MIRALAGELANPRVVLRLLPALLWQALIWLLSSRPWPTAGGLLARLWLLLPQALAELLPADKALHATFYAILALLWVWGLPLRQRIGAAWLLATAWGALDEWHQAYVPGRTADLWDLLADGVGAALALGVYAIVRRRPTTPAN